MNNVNRAMDEVKDEGPELKIVAATHGAIKKTNLSAPILLAARIHARRPRAELAVLGWRNRAIRLAGRK
jgi:hypothetical protein